MPNKRSKPGKLPDYAVRFVGYSARVVARKGNADYGYLDFVSRAAGLFADNGWVTVPKRSILPFAVADLPFCH